MNADKHFPASSARSTKRRVRGDASVSGSLQLQLTDREATAFMSKQRSGLRMSALQVEEGSSYEKKNFPLSSLQVERIYLGMEEAICRKKFWSAPACWG